MRKSHNVARLNIPNMGSTGSGDLQARVVSMDEQFSITRSSV
jgi:hypothetical protein